jgi:single-stranded-DNA-specific exonuclease
MTHSEGQAHGSGRSIEGFHLLDALTAVHADHHPSGPVFSRFGGHAHAVGFSLPTDQLDRLRQLMNAYASTRLTEPLLSPDLECDLELPLAAITDDFYAWLQRCAPFGNSHPEPTFISRAVPLQAAPRTIKDKHICLQLGREGKSDLSALGWTRTTDWPAKCAHLSLDQGSIVDLAYRIRKNPSARFGGLELELCDLRIHSDFLV